MTEHCVYCSVCILRVDLLVKSWRIVEKDMRNSSVKVLGMLLSSGTCECYRWEAEGVYKWRHRGECHTSALPNAFTAVLVFFSGMLIYRKRAWFSQQNHFIRYQFVNIVDTQGSVWQEREVCVVLEIEVGHEWMSTKELQNTWITARERMDERNSEYPQE